MGNAPSVQSKIEIEAPPATVRAVFLDLPKYQSWQSPWYITPIDPAKTGPSLEAGDVLKVTMGPVSIHTTVIEHTGECLAWDGSFYGLIAGKHYMRCSPSEVTPGGTTFTQSENLTGPFSVFYRTWSDEPRTSKMWEQFATALKAEAEKQHAQSNEGS